MTIYKQTGEWHFLGPPTLAINSIENGFRFVTEIDGDREVLRVSSDIKDFAEHSHRKIFADSQRWGNKDNLTSYISDMARGVLDNPRPGVSFYIFKAARAWYGTYSHRNEGWAIAIQAVYFLLFLTSLVKLRTQRLQAQHLVFVTGLTVMYFWSIAVLFEPLVRYMVAPIGMLFLVLPALGLENNKQLRL